MNSTHGVVTEHVIALLERQVHDHGLVVWYDSGGEYADVVSSLDLPNTRTVRYEGSFVRLRWEIDQQGLLDGESPPRLIVYVPASQEDTHHALVELEAAGVVIQPGQQPAARNTRLSIVARNALKGALGSEVASKIESQVDGGHLRLRDLDALADRGGELTRGVLTLIFGTGNAIDVALTFLDSDRFDKEIADKDAEAELADLLHQELGLHRSQETGLLGLRERLERLVLVTDLVTGLGDALPRALESVPVATSQSTKAACRNVAQRWRIQRDTRESYVRAATRVENDLILADVQFDPSRIEEIDTFPVLERALLEHVTDRLLEDADAAMLAMTQARLSRFWCDVEPKFQALWALVASAARVLLEARRVDQALSHAPTSVQALVREYAQTEAPWCLLDRDHRRMESLWSRFEAGVGFDEDAGERLVIRARQRYEESASGLARHFVRSVDAEGLATPGVLLQRQVFDRHVRPALGSEKIAFVWVDALRYEMAEELSALLDDAFVTELQPAIAAVPTITEIGMSALLPGAEEGLAVVPAGEGRLAAEINGTLLRTRKDRVTFLMDRVGIPACEAKLGDLLPRPTKKVRESIAAAEFVLVTSLEIDEAGEQGNILQARRQMDGTLNDLRRGMGVLTDLGVTHIVLAADHGHVFAGELAEDRKIDAPGGDTADLHRRVWVGRGGQANDAYMRASLSALGMEGDLDVATPWNFSAFKCKGGSTVYFHGGLSPQELIVPVMTLRPIAARDASTGRSGIDWQITPGSARLTTRFFSVQLCGTNTALFELVAPRVRLELRAQGKSVSLAVSASYGFDESGSDVALRVDETNDNTIEPNTIALMVTEDIDQKTVGLYLLDATTGVELARVDRIEVDIAL